MEQHQLIPEPELQHFNNIQIKIQDYFLEWQEARNSLQKNWAGIS